MRSQQQTVITLALVWTAAMVLLGHPDWLVRARAFLRERAGYQDAPAKEKD